MNFIYEGKGETIESAFLNILKQLTKNEALYKVQVAGGDWVVGIKVEKPNDWSESHRWEDERKLFYRKQVENCSDLCWEDIRKGCFFYCFRDWPEKGFSAGHTYHCNINGVISGHRGSQMFNPVDVPFYFRMATEDEIEQYCIERRKRLQEEEEMRQRALASLDDDDYDDDD